MLWKLNRERLSEVWSVAESADGTPIEGSAKTLFELAAVHGRCQSPADHLASRRGEQGLKHLLVDGLGDESDGTVGEEHQEAVGVDAT